MCFERERAAARPVGRHVNIVLCNTEEWATHGDTATLPRFLDTHMSWVALGRGPQREHMTCVFFSPWAESKDPSAS